MEIGLLSVRLGADTAPLKRGIEEAQAGLRGLDNAFAGTISGIARTLTQLGGKSGFSAIAGQLAGNIQNSVLQGYIANLRSEAFGSSSGKSSALADAIAGIGGRGLGSILSGRAGGGAIAAGQPVMVGERGPEVFTPFSGGWVTPNGAGGGAVNIHMTVVTPDANSFRMSQGQIMGEAAAAMRKANRYL